MSHSASSELLAFPRGEAPQCGQADIDRAAALFDQPIRVQENGRTGTRVVMWS